MKLRTIALSSLTGVASLALVGIGAHGVFTQSTQSQQKITAGYMHVTLSAPGATGDGTTGNPLVLPDVGPTQSSFMTSVPVTVTNNSNITVNEISIKVGASNDGSAASASLQSEMWACLSSGSSVLFNEPLSTAVGYGTFVVGTQLLAPGATDNYSLTLYAGPGDNGCGGQFTAISGGAFQPSPQQSIVAGATNSSAASLDNAAEGGVVTPNLVFTFNG